MLRLITYLILFGLAAYSLYKFFQGSSVSVPLSNAPRPKKRAVKETWVQVYETASLEEANEIQERLLTEKLDCVVYEQGKKDIHGHSPKGVGIAVPKMSVGLAQKIISRIPV